MAPRAPALALAVVVLSTCVSGLASGATAIRFEIASAEDVRLEGDVGVEVSGGGLVVASERVDGPLVLDRPDGVAYVVRLRYLVTNVDGHRQRVLTDSAEDPRRLDEGRLLVRFDDAPARIRLDARDAAVRVEGPVSASGRPVVLGRDHATALGGEQPREVRVSWRPGWTFFGAYDAPDPLRGFPVWGSPRASLEGPLRMQVYDGVASFTADGRSHEVRLGTSTGDAASPVREETVTYLVFEGTASVDVPLGERWGLAGPTASWGVDGEAAWRRASGSVDVDGHRRELKDADVHARGLVSVRPEAGLAAPVAPPTYRGGGDVRSIEIDGAEAVAPVLLPASTTAWSVTALLSLLVAAKAALFFYTRIRSDEVLAHPVRKRIFDAVLSGPGVHKRELHRATGGGWGAFEFHLRLLVSAGYLRIERTGGYALVYAAATRAAGRSAIPNPVARTIYETLPADGSTLRIGEVARKAAVARSLVRYHVGRLATRGLVRVEDGVGPQRVGRRVP